jgi:hypothetical protein
MPIASLIFCTQKIPDKASLGFVRDEYAFISAVPP